MKLLRGISAAFILLIGKILPVVANDVLDFNSAVARILSRSTGIEVQESTLKAVQSKNIPSRLFFLPTLTFSGRTPFSAPVSLIMPIQSLELTSQLNLFKWGADYMGARASYHEELSQGGIVGSTILQVEGSAVHALISEIQKKKEIEINLEIVRTQTELSEIAQERYKAGYLSLQEAEKVAVDLANAKASLMDARINENDARAQLENLLGHSSVSSDWPWIQIFRASDKLPILDQHQDIARRPDWLAAQHKVKFQEAKASQNWRLMLPSVDLQFSYGNHSNNLTSVTSWVGYLSFAVPLFDRLSVYSGAQQQFYLQAVSEAQLEQVQRAAKAEWDSSSRNFKISLESALSRDETLKISRKLYRDNQRRFHEGRISSNDLAVDRGRMFQAELNAIQGWGAAHLSFTKLCHSLGYRLTECLGK